MTAASDCAVRRVLLVEDNPDSRDTLRALLEAWGHRVEVAADGAAGLEKALGWRPDVAVVDIGLPLLDGYGVARGVRKVMRDGVFLIALTGFAQPDDRRRAFEAGFNVHMAKPADFDVLAQLLDEREQGSSVRGAGPEQA